MSNNVLPDPLNINIASPITTEGRVPVEAVSGTHINGINGNAFVGDTLRLNVASPSAYNIVVIAGSRTFVVNELIIGIDAGNLTDGHFHLDVFVYSSLSNGNSWTHTPLAPKPVGRSTNMSFINVFPETTIDVGVTVPTLTGSHDYLVYFTDYFINTQGNLNTKDSVISSFFDGDRSLVVPAGSSVLVRTVVTGDAGGSVDTTSVFFTYETDEF